jgi:hypothetical protein
VQLSFREEIKLSLKAVKVVHIVSGVFEVLGAKLVESFWSAHADERGKCGRRRVDQSVNDFR